MSNGYGLPDQCEFNISQKISGQQQLNIQHYIDKTLLMKHRQIGEFELPHIFSAFCIFSITF